MFRIVFDPSTSQFVVQILQWQLFWVSCRTDGSVVQFKTYDDATQWVDSIGLRRAYAEKDCKDLYSFSSPR